MLALMAGVSLSPIERVKRGDVVCLDTPPPRISFTASSLNSQLIFRRCISIVQFQKYLILVSMETAAAQTT